MKIIGIIIVVLLIVGNIGASVYLYYQQVSIHQEIDTIKGNATTLGKRVANIKEGLGATVQDLSSKETLNLERRNSIKVTLANQDSDFLEASYALGSDISTVTRIFQDWGDHSQTPKVDNIVFYVKGKALDLAFVPVTNPENNSVVVVIQAESTSLGEGVQVETTFDLLNNQVTQTGPYTQEPL